MSLTTALTSPLTSGLTTPLIGGQFLFGDRLSFSGVDFLDPDSQAFSPRGVNQGTWGENYSIDAPAIAGYNANHVRLLIRSNLGGPLTYDAGVDAYEDNGTNYFLSTHSAQFMQEIDWATAENLWVIVAYDSDQGQGVGRNDTPVTGWDFFDGSADAAAAKEKFFKGWEWIATQCRGRPYILAYELLPEPLPFNSVAGDAVTLRAFYRELIARVRAIDTVTPFLIGPRASYSPNNLDEALLSERTDCIYTIDALTNRVTSEGTIAALIEGFYDWCALNSVPGLIQQLGRNTDEDIGDINDDLVADTTENIGLTALNGSLSVCNALGVPYTSWQYHQNTNNPGAYGWWYKTVYPGSGADNWTPKTTEIASYTYHLAQTGSAVIAAAESAAAAVTGGKLFRVKDDLSNVWQDTAATVPVTALGQQVARIDAVVGGGNFTQATAALRPLLAQTKNGYYTLDFSPAGSYLSYGSAFFSSGGDTAVIISARAPTSNATRVLFQCGTSGTNPRYPYLVVTAADGVEAHWRGDDTFLRAPTTVTTGDDRSVVLSCTKSGANLKAFINGVQEGATVTDAVGALASLTRTYWGAGTNAGSNAFGGKSPMLFLATTVPTDEQRRAIERAGAWLGVAPFRGAIPA